ncbi:MAG: 2OG-Fe(II) oxygenase [Terracidiphilus sp.]|jgi:hypothetical protein
MAKYNRTSEVLSFSRIHLSLDGRVEDLLQSYKSAVPFPHHVFDNLFPGEMLDSLVDELPPLSSDKWVHERHEQLIKSNLRSATDLGDHAFHFASVLHSAGFLYFISEITGVRALLPDPYLTGAGYHIVPEGGKFDVHADRNADHNSGLERRLVMLIYLNKAWRPEFGGQLELWNMDGTRCEKVIEPIFNRTVIFEIGDKNFHAVRPVAKGLAFPRRSFAVYFHTVGKNLVMHNSLYAPKIFQDKESLFRRILRDTAPPVLVRALKSLKSPRY